MQPDSNAHPPVIHLKRASVFSLDDLGSWPGFIAGGEYWNGFDCPYVCREVAESILARFSPDHDDLGDSQMIYTVQGDVLIAREITLNPDEPITIRPVMVEYAGETFPAYPVGAHGWTWWGEYRNSDADESGEV